MIFITFNSKFILIRFDFLFVTNHDSPANQNSIGTKIKGRWIMILLFLMIRLVRFWIKGIANQAGPSPALSLTKAIISETKIYIFNYLIKLITLEENKNFDSLWILTRRFHIKYENQKLITLCNIFCYNFKNFIT